jgi:hypothetical protein
MAADAHVSRADRDDRCRGRAAARRCGGSAFDSAIDVQTFEYAIGPKTFFSVNDADVADKSSSPSTRSSRS